MFGYSYFFRSNTYSRICFTVLQDLLSYAHTFCGNDIFAAQNLPRSFSTKLQHIHKNEIATPPTSHRLTLSARPATLPRACLFFACRGACTYLRTYALSLFLSFLVPWCRPSKKVRTSYVVRARALPLDICFFLNSCVFVNSMFVAKISLSSFVLLLFLLPFFSSSLF